MSQVLTDVNSPELKSAQTAKNFPLSTITCLVLATGVAAHLPFVVSEFTWLWNTEHYSFFPLAIIAFFWLAWQRLRDRNVTIVEKLNGQTLSYLVINLCLIVLASLAGSAWLGWVSFLFFLWTMTHYLLDSESIREIRGTFLILLLIVPLPLNMDTALVIRLQKIATAQGSLLLDYFGIMHSVSGVAIRLPEKMFLIDDACSGIHSLFSALTTMLVYAVYRRYGIIRIVVDLLQTVLWVLVANSIRVFLIVYAFTNWDAGLEDGWRHQVLGFVSYVFILLMAISTDEAIRYFFPPPSEEDEDDPGRRRRRAQWFPSATAWLNYPFGQRISSVLMGCFLLGFILSGAASASRAWKSSNQTGETGNFEGKIALDLTEKDLPQEVNGWKRVGFKAVNRDKNDLFGANSLIWTYENNGVQTHFSIDGGYPGFHDLWFCYSSVGWSLRRSDNPRLPGSLEGKQETVATELQLYRGSNEQAYVLYTCIDAKGDVVEPPPPAETFVRNFFNRLRSGSILSDRKDAHILPPVIQFQAYTHTDTEFFAHERSGVRELFSTLRDAAYQRVASARQSSRSNISESNR